MFEAKPTARADLKPGTVYAVAGEDGWLYYGQATNDKSVGFFRHRERRLGPFEAALEAPVMAVIDIFYPSITRALRSGKWKKLGRAPLAAGLAGPRMKVQWPTGTLTVTVWADSDPGFETRVEDPEIQEYERMAVWDAEAHVPARLTADFGADEAEWHVGGPIWRERRVKEEYARRFPDEPWHRLPADWVSTEAG